MCCCFSHGIFVALRPKGSQSCSVNIYWLCQSNGNMVVKLHAVNRRHLSISCNIREVSKPKRLFFGDADRLTLRILQLFAQGQPIGQPGAREKCPCHLWGFSSVCIFSRPPQGFQNFEVIQETKTPKRHVTKVALKTKKTKKTISKVDFSDFYWTPRHEKGWNCKVLCGSWAASKCPATRINGQKIPSLYRALIPCMSFQRLSPLIAQLHTRSQVLWDKINHQFPNQCITGKVISVSIPESYYWTKGAQRCKSGKAAIRIQFVAEWLLLILKDEQSMPMTATIVHAAMPVWYQLAMAGHFQCFDKTIRKDVDDRNCRFTGKTFQIRWWVLALQRISSRNPKWFSAICLRVLTYWIWRSELEAGLFRCTMEPWPRWIHVFKTPFWQPVLSFWLEWRQNHYLSELQFPSIATINVSFQTWQTSYQALKRRQSKTVQRRDPRLPPAMTPALGGSNTQCSCWAHVFFLK